MRMATSSSHSFAAWSSCTHGSATPSENHRRVGDMSPVHRPEAQIRTAWSGVESMIWSLIGAPRHMRLATMFNHCQRRGRKKAASTCQWSSQDHRHVRSAMRRLSRCWYSVIQPGGGAFGRRVGTGGSRDSRVSDMSS